MRSRLLLVVFALIGLLGCVSRAENRHPNTSSDIRSYSGVYSFDFTDTDEDASVVVRFRQNRDPYRLTDWLADGKMEDRIRNRSVTFTNAFVTIEKTGSVVVDAEFVRFRVNGRHLEWIPSYSHPLHKK